MGQPRGWKTRDGNSSQMFNPMISPSPALPSTPRPPASPPEHRWNTTPLLTKASFPLVHERLPPPPHKIQPKPTLRYPQINQQLTQTLLHTMLLGRSTHPPFLIPFLQPSLPSGTPKGISRGLCPGGVAGGTATSHSASGTLLSGQPSQSPELSCPAHFQLLFATPSSLGSRSSASVPREGSQQMEQHVGRELGGILGQLTAYTTPVLPFCIATY